MIPRLTALNVLLASLTVSSGVVDAIAFLGMGKVFSAFMTGNLVFLGLRAADAFPPNGPNVVRVAVALAAFALGVFVSGRIIRRVPARAGGLSTTLAGVLLAQIVFLAGWMAVSGRPAATFTTCLTGFAALAMGMQSGAIGALDVKAVFTTAATGAVINLSREAADPGVSATNPRQLAAILVCLVVGATVGGLLLVGARPHAPVVPPLATAVAIAASLVERRGALGDLRTRPRLADNGDRAPRGVVTPPELEPSKARMAAGE